MTPISPQRDLSLSALAAIVGLLLPLVAQTADPSPPPPQSLQPQDSMLAKNCSKDANACGECETTAQEDLNEILNEITGGKLERGSHWSDAKLPPNASILPQYDLETVLARVADSMRKNNAGLGGGKLNFIVIGDSGSTQKTRPGFPRIALKSPDGEMWVTFNTDPQSPGYNELEIMRWNGKKGKFEFQELSFPDPKDPKKNTGHVDLTGAKCISCHKSPARPNWDTYRAWASVVPPRDDFLEANPPPQGYDGYSDREKAKNKDVKPDALANAYIDLMEKISTSRSNSTALPGTLSRRLQLLDIPFDPEFIQKDPKPEISSDRDKIAAIREQITDKGFYRVPHFPRKLELKNFSMKTARNAGPAHLAFDQLMGQQMCQAAQTVVDNKYFDRMKYLIAGLVHCESGGSVDEQRIQAYLPEDKDGKLNWLKQRSSEHFKSKLPGKSGQTTFDKVLKDTQANHLSRDDYKTARHERYVKDFLRYQGQTDRTAINQVANSLSRETTIGVGSPWTAISDPGGVKGVGEGHTNAVAAFRYLLEPLGVPVGSWSMTVGKDNTDTSYAFSDQFIDTLRDQRQFARVFQEAGNDCARLQEMSRQAIGTEDPDGNARVSSDVEPAPGANCNEARMAAVSPANPALFAASFEVAAQLTEPRTPELIKRCADCHDDQDLPFLKLSTMKAGDDKGRRNTIQEVQDWMNSNSGSKDGSGRILKWGERVRHALTHGVGGSKMPPRGWSGGDSAEDEEKRSELAAYFSALENTRRGEAPRCGDVTGIRNKGIYQNIKFNGDPQGMSGAGQ